MAEQTVLRPGASAEISLAPEELGHLRLTVEGSEGALRIVIEAARPETADLLRRHAETLRQELRQEGLGSVNVSIGGGDARRGGGEAPPQPGGGGGQAPAGPFARAPAMKPGLPSFPPAVRPRAAGGHLDLRFQENPLDTTAVAPSAASAAPAPSAGPARGVTSDFNTFLKMLTVQMQNQDPLDPIDSADYTVQLATFSGVEQQVKTNELLGALSIQLALSGLAEMAGWVGKEARAAMPAHFDGSPITLSPNPVATADSADLVVRDAEGREVARGPIPVSSEPIEWAGVGADGTPLPSGTYSFQVVSLSHDEVLSTDPCEVQATVAEVRAQGGQMVLVMAGGAVVPADSVTALRDLV